MGIILEDGPQGTTAAAVSAFTGRSICVERPVFYFSRRAKDKHTLTPQILMFTLVLPGCNGQ